MLFTQADIQSELHKSLGNNSFKLVVVNEVDSTNNQLLGIPASNNPQIYIANSQNSGRGRFGKSWDSEPGKSLCLSIRLPMQQNIEHLMGFSLVVALAIKSAIQPLITKPIQLKWPNDILVDNKKLCGVLIETNTTSLSTIDLVIGIGMNICPIESGDYASIALEDCGLNSNYTHGKLVASLVSDVLHYSKQFDDAGFELFRESWLEQEQWLGVEVTVTMANGQQNMGIYKGLDNQGQIEIEVNGEMKSFNAGEISLRRIDI